MSLGWEVETVNGEKILDHDGSDWGVKTFVIFVPARGIVVVVFVATEKNGEAVIKKVVEVSLSEQAIRGYDVSSDTKRALHPNSYRARLVVP